MLGNLSLDLVCVALQGWSIQLHLEQAQKNVTAFKDDASQFRPGRFLNDNKELKRYA